MALARRAPPSRPPGLGERFLATSRCCPIRPGPSAISNHDHGFGPSGRAEPFRRHGPALPVAAPSTHSCGPNPIP
eukprot:7196437-Heterocapsa_arctica.AAC.1